ncbi:MAG: fibronectin type III domain-containing protein, partial [Chloroflexi bacterium]|nr:fibronectin type III domain-containing protein [Chloroflexota bacterium]
MKVNRAGQLALALLGAAVLLLVSGALAGAGGSAPAAPSELRARILADGLKITLLWDDNAEDEEQFILERSSASAEGPWGVAALLPADSTEYNDGGLRNRVTYWYRVAATNAAGTSTYSNVASGTASVFPGPPPPGDADCNGTVTATDAALVLQFDA